MDNNQQLNVYLAGTGLIGSELLKQLQKQSSTVSLCGVMDISKMLFAPAIPFSKAKVMLEKEGMAADIGKFVAVIPEGAVFVDCTASQAIAGTYKALLGKNVSIVTPNKKANSGPLTDYLALRKLMKTNDVSFLYDTNVGAGLPVIKTVQRLVRSNEKNFEIDAILSGTLSYLFNTFSGSKKSFAEVVKDAQNKGFTEPDPRDDLSGLDMARKMLILMREIGMKAELSDIEIEPLLPKKISGAPSVDAFYAELKNFKGMETKRDRAAKKRKVLRYIASLKNGKANLSLVEADPKNPFYSLTHCDNMIAIHTDHYKESPLIIRGPGAGAEVTAAGILSNIISLR